jgi:predicted nucleic acid-binding protein
MIVLDACVLAAFADPENAHHDKASTIMARPGAFAMSALTGAEVMVPNVNHDTEPDYWSSLFAAFAIRVFPVAEADMSGLAALRASSRLKMPDVIVLHLAQTTGASIATFDAALAKAATVIGVPVLDTDS